MNAVGVIWKPGRASWWTTSWARLQRIMGIAALPMSRSITKRLFRRRLHGLHILWHPAAKVRCAGYCGNPAGSIERLCGYPSELERYQCRKHPQPLPEHLSAGRGGETEQDGRNPFARYHKTRIEKADWKQQHFQSAYLFVRQISFRPMPGLPQLKGRCTLPPFHKAHHLPTLLMRV